MNKISIASSERRKLVESGESVRGHGSAEAAISRPRGPLTSQDPFERLPEVGVAERVQKRIDRRVQVAEPVSCGNETIIFLSY